VGKFILKKIFYGIVILFGVITGVFFLQNSTGGNPALLVGGQNATDEIIANIEKDLGLDLPLYKRYFLYLNDLSPISFHNDSPESHVFMDTSKYDGAAMFDLGENTVYFKYPYLRESYSTNRPVSDIIFSTLPDTMYLAFAAVVIAFFFGVLFGVISALRKGTFLDNSTFIVAVAGMSAPSFFTAAIASQVFGELWSEQSQLPIFPLVAMLFALFVGVAAFLYQNKKRVKTEKKSITLSLVGLWAVKGLLFGVVIWLFYVIGYSVFGFENVPLIGEVIVGPGTGLNVTGQLYMMDDFTGDEVLHLENLILPAITLGVRPLALVSQLTRSSMLDVMNEDYIRTARAKGLSEYKVVFKHALKNALNPVITAVSGSFASLLAGAVFVEMIFDWSGIGMELLDAIKNADLPTILGITIVISSFFVLINIIVDIVYGFLDPRIRLK
jgi:peptide/nickel transport system permease protein